MNSLGKHILVEFFGCAPDIMNEVSKIEQAMNDAADKAGATAINSTFHHFSPYGVSGVVVIQESHLAIHTWPEFGYAAVDLFTCGDTVDPWISFDHLKVEFKAQNYSAIEMHRGALGLLERADFDMSGFEPDAMNSITERQLKRHVWFTDKDANQALSLRYTGDILYDKTSEYQRTKIIDTYAYGKALTIDDMVMCTETDEQHYHEMIVHPVTLAHGDVKNVLVIGGGDGGTVRELVKHASIEQITMVEIDANVIEACKQHLPTIAAAFDHEKLNLIIGDGIEHVKQSADETYDLIIIDGSDPKGPAEGLFTTDFYKNVQRVLTPNGFMATQSESPMFNREAFVDLNACLKTIFGQKAVQTLLFSVPTYPSGVWSIQMACKGDTDAINVDQNRVEAFEKAHDLHYYNYDLHKGAFALPNYVKRLLNQ